MIYFTVLGRSRDIGVRVRVILDYFSRIFWYFGIYLLVFLMSVMVMRIFFRRKMSSKMIIIFRMFRIIIVGGREWLYLRVVGVFYFFLGFIGGRIGGLGFIEGFLGLS